ncbi:hypothetical protein [Halostella sp. PRR32]|uniref:hypothetical protein n=1 Tax=Halostella sp. PRR32 TaxID=3098147 RepID=UPI002B1D3595|nr:hypothetical protein [Halostella sp. PRR32]
MVKEVTNHLADRVKAEEHPGMASLDEISPQNSVAVIAEATDPDERHDFSTVTASAFEMPLHVVEQVDQAALAATMPACSSAEWAETPLLTGS